jgi:hypothetical protein
VLELALLEEELDSEPEVKLLSLASEGLSPTLPEPRTQPSLTTCACAVSVVLPPVTTNAAINRADTAFATNFVFFI